VVEVVGVVVVELPVVEVGQLVGLVLMGRYVRVSVVIWRRLLVGVCRIMHGAYLAGYGYENTNRINCGSSVWAAESVDIAAESPGRRDRG